MDQRTEPFSDLSTEDNKASKAMSVRSQAGTVYHKRLNADRTALCFPIIMNRLPSAKVSIIDFAGLISTSTSGRRKAARKRNIDEVVGGHPFSIQQLVQKAQRKGYVSKLEPLKDLDERIYLEKQLKDPSERSYKEAEDVSNFMEKLNKIGDVKEFLGMCCTVPRHTPSRAISCKVNTCQTLIDIGIKCWEYKSGEERIVICHKCYTAKKAGEYISVKAQKYSPWTNEWVFTEKLKSDFKAIKLQQDISEGEHTVVCSLCRNVHHVMCVKYEPFNWETAYGKYCKNFGEYFRPVYVCKNCMKTLDGNLELPRTPAVLFHPEGLAVTELTRKMESEMRQFYYDETADADTLLYVREVSTMKGFFEALPRMKKKFEEAGKPTKWEYIRRNIMVFQQCPDSEYPIALFNMIVFEYPEISAVNISYLDSVKLFHPSDCRRQVYQRCVLSYLREVRKQYQMLYFWVCPPSPGDEYVFYGRPAEKIDRTLSGLPENGLIRWYKEIMEAGKNEEIVEEFLQAGETNPYDEHFLNVPYLMDDFWPAKLETILEAYEKETMEYVASQNSRTNKRQRSARSKKAQQDGPPLSVNARYLQAVKGCNDSLFIVYLKTPEEEESHTYVKEVFEEVDVLCSYMSNRDNFIVDCRENRFDFSTHRRAEYSTLVMCSKIAQESRGKKCILCEKCIREGLYCYACPPQENKVFCDDCGNKHEHKTLRKFKVPYYEDPESGSTCHIFGVIMRRLKTEAAFLTGMAYELSAPPFKRRCCSDEVREQFHVIQLHVAALNSVDEKIHQQTNCRACEAAWLPLFRHKEFCKGSVCAVPSCSSNVSFDNNGIIHTRQ